MALSKTGQKLKFKDLEAAFGKRSGMKRTELVKALKDLGHDEATAAMAVSANPHWMPARFRLETNSAYGSAVGPVSRSRSSS